MFGVEGRNAESGGRHGRLWRARVPMVCAASALSLLAPHSRPAYATGAAATSGITPPDLTWLIGRWNGTVVGNPAQVREVTFTKTPLGIRGVLDERSSAHGVKPV